MDGWAAVWLFLLESARNFSRDATCNVCEDVECVYLFLVSRLLGTVLLPRIKDESKSQGINSIVV